jgi:ferrochelatase
MAEYLGKVTGGRALPPEVVAELQHRYRDIGLGDIPTAVPPPLTRWTLEQGRLLELALKQAGRPLPVYVAMRNWHPFIADTVARMRADGITQCIAICLAPQNSRTSIGLYKRALMAAVEADPAGPIGVAFVEGWADQPRLIAAFADRLAAVYPRACAEAGGPLPVLFTAHSVPCRTIQGDAPDPYAQEARHTAQLVAASFPALPAWYFAFQSQGIAGGPWIGPTVEDTLKAIREEGRAGVVIQPVGFLCDHVEVLYDIDIAFQQTAASLGLRLWRAESLNDSPLLIEALVQVVQQRLAAAAP